MLLQNISRSKMFREKTDESSRLDRTFPSVTGVDKNDQMATRHTCRRSGGCSSLFEYIHTRWAWGSVSTFKRWAALLKNRETDIDNKT
ncbi:hypothetical protein E2C01_037442 [Portunus trituberculatus]|uniref:Uncharacterized protein n=1 Tax=Portunus trituberculatus TaxID=210409 RepID=A0A5B7F857_PORTR|nr:hypothetical protein [Portunus trituberculatus]